MPGSSANLLTKILAASFRLFFSSSRACRNTETWDRHTANKQHNLLVSLMSALMDLVTDLGLSFTEFPCVATIVCARGFSCLSCRSLYRHCTYSKLIITNQCGQLNGLSSVLTENLGILRHAEWFSDAGNCIPCQAIVIALTGSLKCSWQVV